jgi:hypothetical protein
MADAVRLKKEGKTLEEIALALGYKNKSSVSRLLQKAAEAKSDEDFVDEGEVDQCSDLFYREEQQ